MAAALGVDAGSQRFAVQSSTPVGSGLPGEARAGSDPSERTEVPSRPIGTGPLPWSGRSLGEPRVRAAWRDAEPRPYWTDTVPIPEPAPALRGRLDSDLVIIGGGFTGLWAALHAKAQRPERDVTLLEAEACGYGGSGRNGGFCLASLTHTAENGMARFRDEMPIVERLGLENHAALLSDLGKYGIDCDLERVGLLLVAVSEAQAEDFRSKVELLRGLGHDAELLGPEETRAELSSPLYRGGVLQRSGTATLNPTKLVLGLRHVALSLGVRLFEHSPATDIRDSGGTLRVYTPQGRVEADKALLATNAFPPLVRELRRYVLPAYDYALTTERLSPELLESIGWKNRQAVEDAGNVFHYYRLTSDDRILWGGFGAVYGARVSPAMEDRDEMFQKLAHNFFINFPQLSGVRFTHRWAGVIDTCSRFSVFFGSAFAGRLRYAAGYTGSGVAASRFGGRMALDLLDGRENEASDLALVRRSTRPVAEDPRPARPGVSELRYGIGSRSG